MRPGGRHEQAQSLCWTQQRGQKTPFMTKQQFGQGGCAALLHVCPATVLAIALSSIRLMASAARFTLSSLDEDPTVLAQLRISSVQNWLYCCSSVKQKAAAGMIEELNIPPFLAIKVIAVSITSIVSLVITR